MAERLCGQVARRDDARVARRLSKNQGVDGVYQYFLHELGVGDWLRDVRGTAVQREMVPFVQYRLRYSLKTLLGIERMHARPDVLCREDALRRLVGFNAHQVR